MLLYLFLLFTLVPLAELAVLIWIGTETEWWLPILMVIATGVTGAALARWQGWRVIQRIREELRAGEMPASAIIDGVLIFIAGLLLVTPGVLTDLVGVVLLVPPLRSLVKRGVAAWIKRTFEVRLSATTAEMWNASGDPRPSHRDEVIDARVIDTRVEDADTATRNQSL